MTPGLKFTAEVKAPTEAGLPKGGLHTMKKIAHTRTELITDLNLIYLSQV
ncbi:unnamed protein product, partial [marine sediment metagenome]